MSRNGVEEEGGGPFAREKAYIGPKKVDHTTRETNVDPLSALSLAAATQMELSKVGPTRLHLN